MMYSLVKDGIRQKLVNGIGMIEWNGEWIEIVRADGLVLMDKYERVSKGIYDYVPCPSRVIPFGFNDAGIYSVVDDVMGTDTDTQKEPVAMSAGELASATTVKKQRDIFLLEQTQTPRRIREALTPSGAAWLADLSAQIEAIRSTL